ncbi:DNA cytosine methyltransferase [Luteibacter jiangsuensis]
MKAQRASGSFDLSAQSLWAQDSFCSPSDRDGGELTSLDLFCGAGGFSLGLERAGFRVIGAADNWNAAAQSYKANFQHPIAICDLGTTSAPDLLHQLGIKNASVDLLVGGPPCQGFSVQRIGEDHDVRNNLVLEFARFVLEIGPRLFVMENVPGLLGKRGTVLVQEFISRLKKGGYEVATTVINAADCGVPQQRKRVIFTGWKAGQPAFHVHFPQLPPSSYTTVANAFKGLPAPPADLSPHPSDALHRRTRLSPLNQRRIELIPPGGGMQDLPDDLKVNCHKVGADKIGHRYVYGRLAPDRPAATITARFDSFTRGKFGHPLEPRNITLREGARLQSFPDSFKFFGSQEEIAAQIGNAVPPLAAECVARAAAKYLKMFNEMKRTKGD